MAMLGNHPRKVLALLGRPFTFKRDALEVPVTAFVRGLRAEELVNSELQAGVGLTVDAVPLTAAGVPYLLKFDRLVAADGQSYTVQDSRTAYDGTALVFHDVVAVGGTV